MKVVIIVQARMGSSRLPGKVLKEVCGKPLLGHLVERLRRSERTDTLVIATSDLPGDDPIAACCETLGVECFRGDEQDVLSRYYEAAKKYDADAVVRITADCPLIDPVIVDTLVAIYRRAHPEIDYISNTRVRSFPRGMDCEVFSFAALEKAHQEAQEPFLREHVTPYIYLNKALFKIADYMSSFANSTHYRLTVDHKEDFELIKRVIEELYPSEPDFSLHSILYLFEEDPKLPKINAHIEQKSLKPGL